MKKIHIAGMITGAGIAIMAALISMEIQIILMTSAL